MTEPLEISLDPLLVQSITQSPHDLQQSIMKSRATFSADGEKGLLVFSPTSGRPRPNWHQECKELVFQYIAQTTNRMVNVPREAAAEVLSSVRKLEKENPGLRIEPRSDGTEITLAGETASVLQAEVAIKSLCSELVTGTASVFLSPDDYDFVQQVKQRDFPANVECTFDASKFSLVLKGPKGTVMKLKGSMEEIASHLGTPVLLDPLVTVFFKAEIGRGKLEKFLQERQCCAALHFTEFPSPFLQLLSDHKEAGKVKAVSGQLSVLVASQVIHVSDMAVSVITTSEEFPQLCQKTECKYGVSIKHVGHEVSVAGFKDNVRDSLAEINAFLQKIASPLPPFEMKVGILVAKSFKRSPRGLQKCLQNFDVDLQCDTRSGILRLCPLHYLKPGWKQMCESSVSEYIKENISERTVVVPEKAYTDIMNILQHCDDDRFVYHYPPYATSISFAGEPSVVKVTEEQISKVCSNHAFMNEEISLKPEVFEYLGQLKFGTIMKKSRNVDVKFVSEHWSLTLSGLAKEVKDVKEHILSLAAKIIYIPVNVDTRIVHYLASKKGGVRLHI
jgi:hypothetical protein